MWVSTDLREDTSASNTFISLIIVVVVLVLAGTTWMFLLNVEDSTHTDPPNTAFDIELREGNIILEHTSGDTIGPEDTDYIRIAGNDNIGINWNDNVTNSTVRPSGREAAVTDSITASTEIAVVSNASVEESLRFVWFATDGTGYTLLSDIAPPVEVGVDPSENSTNSVGGPMP